MHPWVAWQSDETHQRLRLRASCESTPKARELDGSLDRALYGERASRRMAVRIPGTVSLMTLRSSVLPFLACIAVYAQSMQVPKVARAACDVLVLERAPTTFCGLRLGKSDYVTAERRWGHAKRHNGVIHGSARTITMRDGTEIGYEGWATSSHRGWDSEGDNYIIDGFTIGNWRGRLSNKVLHVAKG